ncbi:MAG TPA: lasso peptide biosynthesis B2 protein [Candidatus Binataceae bacterium]|nr:lasso peptide biosynthesis B2 protein [Candidatus Binataceae bacterium]
MSIARKTFAAEAVILLCLARIAIAILPFEKLMRWFGAGALEDAENIHVDLDPAQKHIALGVRYMIARGVRFLPFEIGCLPQAMAGCAMLTRRALPVRVSLGVPKRGGMPAHAWLESGNIPIAGTATSDAYAPIARFVGVHAKGRGLFSLHEGRE